jgi:hypothetical protein
VVAAHQLDASGREHARHVNEIGGVPCTRGAALAHTTGAAGWAFRRRERRYRHRTRVHSQPDARAGRCEDGSIEERRRMRGHREGSGARRCVRIIVGSGHAELTFGREQPRLEVRPRHGPIAAVAEAPAHREVVGNGSRCVSGPVQGRSADAHCAAIVVRGLAVRSGWRGGVHEQPSVNSIVDARAFVGGARYALLILFAVMRALLQDHHTSAGARELACDDRPGRAAANHADFGTAHAGHSELPLNDTTRGSARAWWSPRQEDPGGGRRTPIHLA